jgi:hypothetical protein
LLRQRTATDLFNLDNTGLVRSRAASIKANRLRQSKVDGWEKFGIIVAFKYPEVTQMRTYRIIEKSHTPQQLYDSHTLIDHVIGLQYD